MPRRAWYLNLDAELELEHPGARTASRAMVERCRALVEHLGALVPDGDLWWTPGSPAPRDITDVPALAWCPTPGALRCIRESGARSPPAPSWETLRAVNHRAFAASIAQPLPGAVYVRDEATLDAVLRSPSPTGVWLVKRPWSYRGNGRARVRGACDEATQRWLHASMRAGEGVQVEPEVERVDDHGLHGYLSRDGALTWGSLTRQVIDARGQWRATELADTNALDDAERHALHDTAARVAAALRAQGYHGPFGIDAFRWRAPDGTLRYNPLCELNARYSMGFGVGMRGRRVDLDM